MVDKVSIANGAIGLVGGEAIASWPTDINNASVASRSRWAVRLFDTALGAVLSSWPFSDCRRRYNLPRSGTAPAFGYSAQYELDSKILKVVALRCPGAFEREGRFLLANGAETINAIVCERVAAEQLNELVADAVSARLAHRIAMAIGESQAKQDAMKKHARDVMLEATMGDNWEGGSQLLLTSGWTLAAQTSYAPERTALGDAWGGDGPTRPWL